MRKTSVLISLKDQTVLQGILLVPENATKLVIFAHGSGSSRFSPRNNYVAEVVNKKGIATLLFDLLTEQEDEVYETRFNIPLLTKRLVGVTDWVQVEEKYKHFNIGYFGSSTGSAAALFAAAQLGALIKAVVSRGGRPDLAESVLNKVTAATLLIVGEKDADVLKLNQQAYGQLTCQKELHIVPGATHLFEEHGALEKVAEIAAQWFDQWL